MTVENLYNEFMKKVSPYSSDITLDIKPANPLLLKITDEYHIADLKIMFFGQETNGWWGDYLIEGGVDRLQEEYSNFFVDRYCYTYGGQFWNGIKKLEDRLQDKAEEANKSVSLLWNNIVKIGKTTGKGLPSKEIIDWQEGFFRLIRLEVGMLKPDIVFFFTGPNYDSFVSKTFPDAVFQKGLENRTQRQIAKIKSVHLPKRTVRTYHPNYLWRNDFYGYLDDLFSLVEPLF